MNLLLYAFLLILTALTGIEAFQAPSLPIWACRTKGLPTTSLRRHHSHRSRAIHKLGMGNGQPEQEKETTTKKKGFLSDLRGMLQNFDDVVDDFVYKRMGAGEQWYGKRKYDPSGRVDGDYNGMGRSDYFRIEIARVQKEEMEKRKQRRLEEEEAAKRAKKSGI
jgi:hypothetical protein